jgi:hypothetical protein
MQLNKIGQKVSQFIIFCKANFALFFHLELVAQKRFTKSVLLKKTTLFLISSIRG